MAYRVPVHGIVSVKEHEAICNRCAKLNISKSKYVRHLIQKDIAAYCKEAALAVADREIVQQQRRIAFPRTAIRNLVNLIAHATEPEQVIVLVEKYENKAREAYHSKKLIAGFKALRRELRKSATYRDIKTKARQKGLMRITRLLDDAFKQERRAP